LRRQVAKTIKIGNGPILTGHRQPVLVELPGITSGYYGQVEVFSDGGLVCCRDQGIRLGQIRLQAAIFSVRFIQGSRGQDIGIIVIVLVPADGALEDEVFK
jgi:hypothetical protein